MIEATRRLGVSRQTVLQRVKRGELKAVHVRLGRRKGLSLQKSTDVEVEHPVHLFRQQSDIERIQRVVLAASGPEPVRKSEEVGFVDGVKHLDRGALDDFIFSAVTPSGRF